MKTHFTTEGTEDTENGMGFGILKKEVLLYALCVLCGSNAVWGRPPVVPPAAPLDIKVPEFHSQILSCGLKVLYLTNKEMPLVSGELLVPGGKVADPVGKEGLGNLMCGVLRDGGAGPLAPEAFDEALENKAASMGASAELENYDASFKCLSQDLPEVLGLFTDMVRHPQFEAKRLATDRDQDLDGLNRLEDTPDALTRVMFYKGLYAGSPYGRWASPKSLGTVTREDVQKFYQAHFGPTGSVLVLAGNFDEEKVTQQLEAALKGWGALSSPAATKVPGPAGPVIYFYPKEVTQVFVRYGVLGIQRHDPQDIPLRVANYILGESGFTSRLMKEIRSNHGLAYFVDSVAMPFDVKGIFEVIGGTRPDSVKEFLKLMNGILEDYGKTGPTDEELDEAKRSMVEEYAYNFESPFKLAGYKGSLDFHGYPQDYLASYREQIKSVTREQATKAIQKVLKQKNSVLVICGPAALEKELAEFGKVVKVTSIFEPLDQKP